MEVNYEKLLQHSNQMKHHIQSDIAKLSPEILTKKPKPDQWSVLEVIEHLSLVYDKYLTNFKNAIDSAPDLKNGESTNVQRTLMGRLSIYSMKPKGQKRRFKMKTFDFFRPVHTPDTTNSIINDYLERKEQFNELIRNARLKNLKNVKIPTALGDRMRFYVPECFEFILAHEERHMVQIQQLLGQVN